MQVRDAVDLLANCNLQSPGPTTWADLGCGSGTFTLALAELLAPGSTIHAMDRDASALRAIPPMRNDVRLITHRGDFTSEVWPFDRVDGILMANSLHYIPDQAGLIRMCESRMNTRRFLIVEYDTEAANRWVPYPVSRGKLAGLFGGAGYSSVTILGLRPSVYRRAALYAALAT